MKVVLGLCLVLAGCAHETPRDSASTEKRGAVSFVQHFYDWYVPLGDGPTSATRYDSLARNEHAWFSSALVIALKNDLDVQRRDTTGDIVSITADYDPFVASQDPCEHFEARDARHVTNGYLVAVFPFCQGRASEKPSILVEVARVRDTFQIVNFRTPGDPKSDLQKDLSSTRPDTTQGRPD